jgi:hypothetical protein
MGFYTNLQESVIDSLARLEREGDAKEKKFWNSSPKRSILQERAEYCKAWDATWKAGRRPAVDTTA